MGSSGGARVIHSADGLLVLACLQDLWFLTLFPINVILPGVADFATLHTISAIAG